MGPFLFSFLFKYIENNKTENVQKETNRRRNYKRVSKDLKMNERNEGNLTVVVGNQKLLRRNNGKKNKDNPYN